MELESFGFSVLAALLGMALVVGFLVVLSAIMYAIKRLSRETTGRESPRTAGESGIRSEVSGTRELSGEHSSDLPGWVLAGAAAFLAEEAQENEQLVSAYPWLRRRNEEGEKRPVHFAEGRALRERGVAPG